MTSHDTATYLLDTTAYFVNTNTCRPHWQNGATIAGGSPPRLRSISLVNEPEDVRGLAVMFSTSIGWQICWKSCHIMRDALFGEGQEEFRMVLIVPRAEGSLEHHFRTLLWPNAYASKVETVRSHDEGVSWFCAVEI